LHYQVFFLAPDGTFVAGDVGRSGSFIAEPTGSLTQLYQVPVGAALGNYGLQVHHVGPATRDFDGLRGRRGHL
jgi:hypothetical protein